MKCVDNPKFIRLRAAGRLAVALVALAALFLREPYVPRWGALPLTLLAGVLVVWQLVTDLRRMRPRRRMLVLSTACMALTVTFLVMLFVSIDEGRDDRRFMAAFFACLTAVAAIGGVWSFLRWRRLRAQAAERLSQLRAQRRRRSRTVRI